MSDQRPKTALAMLWRAGLCAMALAVVPAMGMTQTVTVQSGEHVGFTRLALDIGPQRDWRLERLADRLDGRAAVRLVLDPPVDGFNISGAFDLIPRTRLAELVVGDGLDMVLACACRIDAERFRDRYLVLDIRPGELDLPPVAPRGNASARETGLLPDTARLLLEARSDRFPTDPEPPVVSDAGSPTVPPPAVAIDLEQAGQIMAEQLARAAAAGLLEASAGRPLSDADPITSDPPRSPPVEENTDASLSDMAAPVFPPQLPLRAETALDLSVPRRISAVPPRDPRGCTGAALPLADWAMGDVVQDGLGALRLGLFDERDQVQRAGVLNIARHYLSFGFGAEAGFWLAQIAAPPADLMALARMFDDQPGPHFPREQDPLSCSDDELLWRYLDGSVTPVDITSQEAGRLQRAMVALPVGLFDQIAPRMVGALQEGGFVNEARNLRDLLWRSGRFSQAVLLRLDRDLGLPLGDSLATRDALAIALRDAGGAPVSALVHAMAFDRETGLPVNLLHLDAAEALLRENGITAGTADLWQEVMLAHAAIGDLERVLALLAADTIAPADRDSALTHLFAAALARQDTAAIFLLARVFGADWRAEGSEAGRVRVAAIAKLRAAGLPQAAEALQLGQRVLILPARPMAEAAPDDDLSIAWHNGDWSRLDDLTVGTHRAIALRMVNGMGDSTQGADPDQLVRDLPRLAEQLADSRVLRDEITALLAAPRPTPNPAPNPLEVSQ